MIGAQAAPSSAEHTRQRRADGAACLAAALEYLRLGYSSLALCPPDHVGVGPTHAKKCKHPGKAPWGSWLEFEDRKPTEDELRRKWRDNATLNVGAAAGKVSGWIRADVEGPLGQAKLLELSRGDLLVTPEFKSGRGDGTGRGLLFGIPAGVIVRTTKEGFAVHDELRFQAKGAQTVLPPSRHKDGGLYEWLPGRSPFEVPLAPMPDWLVTLMRVEPSAGGGQAEATDVDLRMVLSALDGFPSADHYDDWLAVGMILHSVDSGPLMLDIWRRWSEQSDKHQDGDCDAKWPTFGKREPGIDPTTGRPRTLGVGSLFKWAKEATGWHYGPRATIGTKPSTNGKHDATGPPPGDNPPAADAPQTGVQIIVAYFRERYRPVFRRGNAVHCEDGRDVPMGEACSVADSGVIARLADASDAPRYSGPKGPGEVNRNRLPSFFTTWGKVAWGDLLASLPDEDAAELGADAPAREEFRRLVREALLSEVVLGTVVRGQTDADVVTQVERRTVIGWCQRFAKAGPWRDVRKQCWTKLKVQPDGQEVVTVAIRHELFSQLKADRRLSAMGSKTFARRAKRYGVGSSTPNERPHGVNAIVLDEEFVADLLAGLPDDPADVGKV